MFAYISPSQTIYLVFSCNHVFLIVRALPWSGARAHCQALGTDLAEMNTRAEQSGVTRYLNNYRESSLKEEIVFYVL